jgi:hypothetical protein
MPHHRSLNLVTVALVLLTSGLVRSATQESALSPDERMRWMTAGHQSCQAPLIRIPSSDGQFDFYVESPAARAAVVGAAALMNHQPLDAQRVQTAARGGYRIWASRTDISSGATRVEQITIRSGRQPEIKALSVREERLTLGIAPSHGIVEPVRVRFPEFEFPDLPQQDFWVVVRTNNGIQRYSVTATDRTKLLRVCNQDRP